MRVLGIDAARRPRPAEAPTPTSCASREAADVADAVATALHERWQVVDDESKRAARVPARATSRSCSPRARRCPRSKPHSIERDIPYRAENSSVVYTTPDIRHVMLALHAADDPTNELALIAALRTGPVRLQ